MKTERITFAGADGQQLAARLDAPDDPPVAYALKLRASLRAAAETRARRVQGEFANTNFSSNVADLVAAAAHLRQAYMAPAILIGHSLGGAAVLAAAGQIAECKAVVTLNAPSDAKHVSGLFRDSVPKIDADGEAEVVLAGRKFRIKKQFLQDAAEQDLVVKIAQLRRALLVMHSPRDDTVDISNATKIFTAAKHPKSFISLDGADHLLTKREDAVYAANLIAAWVARYLDSGQRP